MAQVMALQLFLHLGNTALADGQDFLEDRLPDLGISGRSPAHDIAGPGLAALGLED